MRGNACAYMNVPSVLDRPRWSPVFHTIPTLLRGGASLLLGLHVVQTFYPIYL